MADFYSGFNDAGARNERSTLAQLQALSGAQNLIGSVAEQEVKEKARKRGEEFRTTLAALGPNATSEQVIAASRPFLEPDKAATLAQGDMTNRRTQENQREMARGRLAQAAQTANLIHEDRMRNATTAEAKAAEMARHNFQIEAIQRDAVANTGARLTWETGAPAANGAATLAAGQPSAPVTSGNAVLDPEVLRNPDMAAAVAKINAGGRAPQDIVLPDQNAAPQAQTPVVGTVPPVAALPAPAVAAAPTAPVPLARAQGGLAPDAPTDLRAQGQAAFEASKAPSSAPVVPQMPKFSGSPKEIAHQENIWKQSQSKSAGAARLAPSSLETAGWEKLLFGTDPKGMGNYSAQQRAQVADERDRIGRELGLSAQEMAMMPYDAKVKQKAIGNMINWGAGVGKAQEQLEKSIDLAMGYVDKLGPGRAQALNKAILAGEKQFNDPDANAYALAVNTVRTEYGRLMTGPTSNAMLPVEAIKKGDQLISNGFDKKSWEEIKSFIRQEAKITKESVDNQVSSLRNSLLPKGAAPETGPAERRAEPRSETKRTVITY